MLGDVYFKLYERINLLLTFSISRCSDIENQNESDTLAQAFGLNYL